MAEYPDDTTQDLDDNRPGSQNRTVSPDDRDEKRRRRRRKTDELTDGQKNILTAFLDLFKGFLAAEKMAGDNLDPDDPLARTLHSLDGKFADALGMDPAGHDYVEFKQKMRGQGYDPTKDPKFISHVQSTGALNEGGKIDTFVKNPPGELLDLICKHESGGNYNIVWSGCKVKPQNLTNMTVQQVMDWQKEELARGSKSTAAGRYQIISGTLAGLVKELKKSDPSFDPATAKFDEAMQDRMAMQLLKRRGLDDYLSGKISQDKFMDNMAYEWASLKKSNGRGAYDGDGLNASVNTLAKERVILTALKAGDNFNPASSGTTTMVASAGSTEPKIDPKKIPGLTPGGGSSNA